MFFFFFQAEDGIRDYKVTGVQTCALPIFFHACRPWPPRCPSRHPVRIVTACRSRSARRLPRRPAVTIALRLATNVLPLPILGFPERCPLPGQEGEWLAPQSSKNLPPTWSTNCGQC